MSRIGLKLIALFMAGLIVAIATLSIIAATISSSIINEIVTNQNVASVNTLENEIADEIFSMKGVLESINSLDLSLPGREEDLAEFWDSQKDVSTEFLAIYNSSGNITFKTDNYKLSQFDISLAMRSGWMGFVKDPNLGVTVQVCEPVIDDGNTIGAAVIGMTMDDVSWLDEIKALMGVDLALFDGDLRFNTTLVDENGNRIIGTRMSDAVKQAVLIEGKELQVEAPVGGVHFYIAYAPMPDINGNIVGAYCAGTDGTPTDAKLATFIVVVIVAAVIIAILAVVIIIIANQNILIKPIKAAGIIVDNVSNGLLNENDCDVKLANDELGDFVRKLEATKGNLNSYISDIKAVLAKMAVGDFTAHPQVEYHGDFTEIRTSFEKIEESLKEIIGNISFSSRDVKTGAGQIAEGSNMLAEGTTQQAAATEEIAATINDIAEKVQQTAQNSSEASNISTQTSDKITYQNNEIQNMLEAMDEIKEKSDQIQNIIKAIDDIAFQTNILALNAAIEAARAGEAGKGFAVVADEVRNLAAKSAESAQQTGDLINATIEAVNKGTVIAESTATTMKEVTELSDRTNNYISDITSATEEQAEAINQIKIGIDRIAQVVHQNSATAEEIAASCQELSSQSTSLETQIRKFTV